ncbi:DUF6458 family protein [Plantactinospora sp. CA-290183]|uniref:DUF6458 family protein n=1 Tax=Plantactinospora sp. CA-290183 TaxID=3240006 RepID=UPI003D93B232
MGIGGSIFLLALGAIFAFAVNVELGWLNIHVVGWVLMLAGLVGLALTLRFSRTRRRRVVAETAAPTTTRVVPAPREQVVEEYHEVRRPAPPV